MGDYFSDHNFNPVIFCNLYSCQGLSSGMLLIPCTVIVQHYFTRRRPIAVGLSSVGLSLGSITTGPIIRLLVAHFGWRGAMLLSVGFTVQGLVCAALLRPIRIYKTNIASICSAENSNTSTCDPVHVDKKRQQSKWKKMRSLFETFDISLWKQKAFIFLLLGRCFGMVSSSVMLTYAISRAVHEGIDSLLASSIVTAFGVGAFSGRFLTGGVANAACTNRLLYYSLSTLAGAILVLATIFAEGQIYIYVAIYSLYGVCACK